MKTFAIFGLSLLAVAALQAGPVVSNVKMSQAMNGTVTVGYQISGAPAIVTFEIETNSTDGVWRSIGAEPLVSAVGANQLVEEGPHVITWKPHKAWPGHKIAQDGARAVVTAWATNAPPDYLVANLVEPYEVRYYTSTNALPDGGLANDIYRTSKIILRRIHAKGQTFMMGGSKQFDSGYTESTGTTPHLVTLTRDYYIGIYELTQAQYSYVTGKRSGYDPTYWPEINYISTLPATALFMGDYRGTPSANRISWPLTKYEVADASLIGVLRSRNKVLFELPTEAEWEYACRAGADTAIYDGVPGAAGRSAVAWYKGNDGTLHKVGEKAANGFGLYDTLGNVAEVCLDCRLTDGARTNSIDPVGDLPTDSVTDVKRVYKGGCYYNEAFAITAANYGADGNTGTPSIGARLVVVIEPHKFD